jgi:hypothetical protein
MSVQISGAGVHRGQFTTGLKAHRPSGQSGIRHGFGCRQSAGVAQSAARVVLVVLDVEVVVELVAPGVVVEVVVAPGAVVEVVVAPGVVVEVVVAPGMVVDVAVAPGVVVDVVVPPGTVVAVVLVREVVVVLAPGVVVVVPASVEGTHSSWRRMSSAVWVPNWLVSWRASSPNGDAARAW